MASSSTTPPVLGEMRLAGASKGVALTTTLALTPLPAGTRRVRIAPRNLSTAVVVRVAINPFLSVLKTIDGLATAPTDYSEVAQDADAATDIVLSSLPTAANGGYLYVGSGTPTRGLQADVDSTNGTASVMTAEYWVGTAWAALTITDGTASGGATFAQDGNITWTVPTDWAKRQLQAESAKVLAPHGTTDLYWARFKVSVALDSSTTLNSLLPMNRSTLYGELNAADVLDARIERFVGGDGTVEALTDAGTANLLVNCFSAEGRFTS